jgi:hypothetical protein
VCRAVGVPSIRHLEHELTPGEINLWLAKYYLDPWGEVRGDLRMARIAATIVAMNSAKRTRLKLEDFMLEFDQETATREMSDDELKRAAKAWAASTSQSKVKGKPDTR